MTITDSAIVRADARSPEPDAWPGLYDVPSGPRTRVAAVVAKRIFAHAMRRLEVRVETGGVVGTTDGRPTIVLHRPEEFFARVGADGLIGFGEGYLSGAWDSPDLDLLLTTMATEIATIVPDWMQRLRSVWQARMPSSHRNSEDQTRDNISHHYDLSNDLFATFLDETLSYSSALFESEVVQESAHSSAGVPTSDDMAEGQARKIERLLDRAGVVEGSRVLEIGTGWGELAIRAARRGATVRSVTLSVEQQELARERIAEAGFADRVEVDLLDYRQVVGTYDAVVSVEMIEAVGHEFWPTYFAKIDSLLAPEGRVAIQAITMPHDRMLATRGGFTWINKYVFPGGFLPSTEAIDQVTREHTALRITDRLSFGLHYAETLRQWDEAFGAASADVRRLGFDAVFERMWHFYLAYSRAGFAARYLDVQQLTFAKESV
ncbi:cyclopropane-fatty-acyl-phospholipid synthase family protein [Nocardioides sp. JQ2195]|uniref:SAM-dependent methyltransferase n=1 Tax=Nocardioides sp. JQ2195 TaxID=2592334 RepID=UPI001F0F9B6E|nr:cyclopropane-fatty-acyl-phospholipid synthase family protein [Nocardioides sp. JQ2195]